MSLFTLAIDSLQKKNEKILLFYLQLRVLYTEIQPCLVNNSVKSQQMSKMFYGVNQGTMYYRLIKKIRDQKSHATVPLKGWGHQIF